jgi:hypothetical protein
LEYDVVPALHRVPDARGGGEQLDVSGYIIIVGGTPWSRPTAATPLAFALGAPAVYSTPQLGAIYLGVNPDG